MLPITSATNPRIKDLVRLKEPGERRRTGCFTIESSRELERALDAGFEPRALFICPQRMDDAAEWASATHAPCYRITPALLEKAAYRQNPQGLIAVMRSKVMAASQWLPPADALVVVCSGLEKPGNVGAIVRTANGAGASAVCLDDADADVFNPNAIRASTGAVFTTPIVCDAGDAIRDCLRQRGVRLIAADPRGEALYHAVDWTGPSALVLGAEAQGLGEAWRDEADVRVRVPMRGRVDSLNVSATAAVVLYEALRQRGGDDSPA